MTVFTTTRQPLIPMLPAAWVLTPSAGFGVNISLSRFLFWHADVQVAAFLPRTYLHIEDRRFMLGLPTLQLGTGFGARF